MKRSQADPFLQGYLDAALFTTDPHPPSGCDYVESGRADEMFPALPAEFIEQAKIDCEKFTRQNSRLLTIGIGRNAEEGGRCFWYSRNGHGTGFFDSEYWAIDVRDKLQKAADSFGEHCLMPEDLHEIEEHYTHDACPKCGTKSLPAEKVPDQALRSCPKCGHDWFENLNAPVTP